MADLTTIPIPATPFLDQRTGAVSRSWYLFFQNLWRLTGGGGNNVTLDDLQLGPVSDGIEALLALIANAEVTPACTLVASSSEALESAFAPPAGPDDLTPVTPPIMGASGAFTTVDLKTVTVSNGIIVSII